MRLASLPPVAPAPHIQWCSQGLCGETMGKRGPLLAHSLCRRLGHARPPVPAGISFLGVLASQPPPAATAHSPALSFPGASRLWPLSQLKDGGEPWSPLPHPPAPRLLHAGTRAVGTLDSSWAPVPSSAHPQPSRPQRGERNRPPPKEPLQDGALEILSTNYESRDKRRICKSISERTFPGKSLHPDSASDRATYWVILSLPLPLLCSKLGMEAHPMLCQPLCG